MKSKIYPIYFIARSCDTEDWSNGAENTAAHLRNKLYKQYKTIILNCNIVFTLLLYF